MMILKFVISRNGPRVLFPWNYIGRGTEGKVYRKGELAYKYYHKSSYCSRLTLEDTKILENIITNRVLLPRDTLYTYLGEFRGYTTQYIKNLGLFHYMELPTALILQDFHLLTCDCEVLGRKNFLVYDFMPRDERVRNYSFNQGLYFVDPGKYHMDFSLSEEEAILENKKSIERFLYYRVISKYVNEKFGHGLYDYDRLRQFKDIMEEHPGLLMNYIRSDIKEDNLKEYVKRKVL